MYTEFISSEGLIRDAAKSVQKLDVYDYERPVGIQIFGAEIESMREAAAIAEAAGPDILDINYGCPVHKVACKGAGAGILLDIDKMVSMTAEIVKRVNIPVTVKTRLGWSHDTIRIVEVAERLQDVGIQAISIHERQTGLTSIWSKTIQDFISRSLAMETSILRRKPPNTAPNTMWTA